MKKLLAGLALAAGLLAPAAWAQDAASAPAAAVATAAAPAASAADAAPAAAASAPAEAASAPAVVPNKGDTAWMMVSTLLVILMTVPGLALFYGGLVRSKNMLSILMQVMVGFSLIVVLWVLYGYSFAFTSGIATPLLKVAAFSKVPATLFQMPFRNSRSVPPMKAEVEPLPSVNAKL